jgi:hypothetical protein
MSDITNNQNPLYSTNTFHLNPQTLTSQTLQHPDTYKIPQQPLSVLEIYGGTAAGLEALLRTGHYIH